jgi:DNA-binding MarR family transcriptional regulator
MTRSSHARAPVRAPADAHDDHDGDHVAARDADRDAALHPRTRPRDGDAARRPCYTGAVVPSAFEESILLSLRRMSRAIDLQSRQLAKVHDLTGPQLVCLRHIQSQERMTPKALAASVSLSQATVTGILDRLERRGLVRRVRSTVDKRVVHLEVTDAGRTLIGDAPSPLSEVFRARLAALPKNQQAAIDEALRRVVEMMSATEVDASPILTTGDVTTGPRAIKRFFESDD